MMQHNHHVCPWWVGYLLIHPLRRFMQEPQAILSPHVRSGMTILEIGPGMGYFTLPLARMVGRKGRVVAVDIQNRMLASLRKRLSKANLSARVDSRLVQAEDLAVSDLQGRIDFALAFAVVHEVPDLVRFFHELHAALKPNATALMSDPCSHFSENEHARALETAKQSGFIKVGEPRIWRSRGALLQKTI